LGLRIKIRVASKSNQLGGGRGRKLAGGHANIRNREEENRAPDTLGSVTSGLSGSVKNCKDPDPVYS
jgi:hypothetical protein